jgi:demethyllactenocin mycarosyltransferase
VAHIAFFSIPAAGHVNPTLGAVSELVRRGHRVSYAVPAPYAAAVTEAGARVVGYRTTMADFAERMLGFDSVDRFTVEDLLRVQYGQLKEAVTLLAPLARAFAADRPDLVVYDTLCWAGRLLAERWRVPSMRSQPMFASNGTWSLGSGYATVDRDHPGLAALVRAVARLLRRLGVGMTADEFFAPDDRAPTLVYLPRAFQYAGDTFGPLTHFVGPCLRRAGSGVVWRPPEPGRPVVLVSLGTVYNNRPDFFRACLAAFTGTPWHAVLAIGDRVDRAALGEPPPNVEVHAWLPESLAVMRHAHVFVNHASMASTMESLWHGVPVVTVPQMAEQRANADRIVELGLGLRLPPADVTAQALRASVATALADPAMSARAGAWRQVLDRAGGSAAAVDALEGLLGPVEYR